MREGHTLIEILDIAYCYGGISSQKLNDLYTYDLKLKIWTMIVGFGDISL